ncbi:MAG: HlyD family efflux transporter periplasmic adaptor subunit [Rhodocyclaceae bacterium]|nr:MAG: HlyD family efflux transporter periplasmic adaptor subunit [Rhodocyclaceae bacterium]
MPDTAAQPVSQPTSRRLKILRRLTGALLAIGLLALLYWGFWGRLHVTTDNAYVGGNVTQISPQVSGQVVAVLADDTDYVNAGQALVRLDDDDARSQLEEAAANLADAVRGVRGLYANSNQSRANVSARGSDLSKAEANLRLAEAEYARRESLYRDKFISSEGLQSARTALDAARAARDTAAAEVSQARSQQAGSEGLVDNTALENHPRVAAAAAKLREAYLARARTTVLAPVSGNVARRSVHVGERVAPGTALMAIIPADQIWVEANFKESELADMRIGQPASLHADLYGSGATYRGKVAGLASGTGAVFATLPPQNASGNWIKVVQRLPVRIVLDDEDVKQHPLRVGLSMHVTVDTGERSGPVLATAPRSGGLWETRVFADQARDADALIARIIAANRQGGQSNRP